MTALLPGVAFAVILAARRLPLELILWDLIVEGDVKPLDTRWQEILLESIRGFEDRQIVT